MSYAIPMEINAVDSAIENVADSAAGLQRALLEIHDNVQSYVAEQQSAKAFKKSINQAFLTQYYKLHSIERQSKDISVKMSNRHPSHYKTEDAAHEISLRQAANDLLQDLVSMKASYERIYETLISCGILSFTSFSTKRTLKKIYQTLDKSIDYTKLIKTSFSKICHYSEEQYVAARTEKLQGDSVLTDESFKLHPDDLEFIFDDIAEPMATPPTDTMQRALENYTKLS